MLVIPLNDIDDEGVSVEETVSVASLQPEGAVGVPTDSVTVSGVLEEVGGDYLFRGDLSGEFESTCDRCLKGARLPFDVEVMWNFEKDPKAAFEAAGIKFDEDIDLDDSAMCRPIENDEIDLRPAVWEELALAVPLKFLCREDCQGLCDHCGADLNAGPCGCPVDAEAPEVPVGNQGLAGLAGLFPDLTPGENPPKKREN